VQVQSLAKRRRVSEIIDVTKQEFSDFFQCLSKPLLLLALLGTCLPTQSLAAEQPRLTSNVSSKHTLVIGSVSHNFKKHLKDMQPMVSYLAEGLSEEGIQEGLVLMAHSNDELLEFLRSGQIDLIAESPFSAAYFLNNSNFEVLARRWKGGNREYHGMILVRADSDIQTLSDLRGKKIAFEDAGSSSGYFLPAAAITEAGIPLALLDNPRSAPPENHLGYSFAREEINTATWVMRGIVDAGAISNLDWVSNERMPEVYAQELRVLHETRSIPRSVILVRSDLPTAIKEKLQQRLVNAHLSSDEEAEAILYEFQRTSKYEIPDPELQDSMAEIQRIIELLN